MNIRLLASSIRDQVEDVNGSGAKLEDGISKIINGIFLAVGVVAVIIIILGGVHYATSQGDPSKVKKGKDTMITGLVGLIIVFLAFAIVNFVLNAFK